MGSVGSWVKGWTDRRAPTLGRSREEDGGFAGQLETRQDPSFLYKGAPMRSRTLSSLLLISVLSLALGVPVVHAGDGDFDTLDRLQNLRVEARAAARAKDWVAARDLAEIVLTLDDTEYTADTRLVLVRALEGQGQYGAAIYELKQYQALDLPKAALQKAERLMRRLEMARTYERLSSGEEGLSLDARKTRAAGVSLLVGGVSLTATGAYFIGMDLYWASKNVSSGSWALLGGSLLGVGIGLDIAGAVLIHRTRNRGGSRTERRRFDHRPRIALSAGSESFAFQIGGQW